MSWPVVPRFAESAAYSTRTPTGAKRKYPALVLRRRRSFSEPPRCSPSQAPSPCPSRPGVELGQGGEAISPCGCNSPTGVVEENSKMFSFFHNSFFCCLAEKSLVAIPVGTARESGRLAADVRRPQSHPRHARHGRGTASEREHGCRPGGGSPRRPVRVKKVAWRKTKARRFPAGLRVVGCEVGPD